MQTDLLEKASKVFTIPQVLINVISRRVRQLSYGHRALVTIDPRMGLCDIALTEVIQGKLSYENTTDFKLKPVSMRIPESAESVPQEQAA